MDAGFFYGADVEIIGVHEIHDDDAEEIVVGESLGKYLRQTTEELVEGLARRKGGIARAEHLHDIIMEGGVLLVYDGVLARIQQELGIDEPGQRLDVTF